MKHESGGTPLDFMLPGEQAALAVQGKTCL